VAVKAMALQTESRALGPTVRLAIRDITYPDFNPLSYHWATADFKSLHAQLVIWTWQLRTFGSLSPFREDLKFIFSFSKIIFYSMSAASQFYELELYETAKLRSTAHQAKHDCNPKNGDQCKKISCLPVLENTKFLSDQIQVRWSTFSQQRT
jgi:hypothetical protein